MHQPHAAAQTRTTSMPRVLMTCSTFVVLAAATAFGGCSSNNSTSNGTSTPASAKTTVSPTAGVSPGTTATAGPTSQPTAVVTSVAGNLDPVLLQASDLPAGMTLRPSQMQLLHAGDTPGLQASGSGDLRAALSDDHNQFLIVIAVVPDTGGVKSLTDAFTLANYLPTLAPNAKDATGAATTVSGAPPGASAFSYGGTVTGPAGQSQRVDGQVLAFAEGNVFLLLNYGSYAAAAPPIDLGALATTIAQRVASASSGA